MKKLFFLVLMMNTSILLCDVYVRNDNYIEVSVSIKTYPLLEYYIKKLKKELENMQDAKIILVCDGLNFKKSEIFFKKFIPLKKQIVRIEFKNMELDSLPSTLLNYSEIRSLELIDCNIKSISSIKSNLDTIGLGFDFLSKFNIPTGIKNLAEHIEISLNFEHFNSTNQLNDYNFEEFYESNNLISFYLFFPPSFNFPDFIFNNPNLNRLIIFGGKFDIIPDKFDKLQYIRELLIYGIKLKSNCFPISLKKLMKKLNIHYPKFETCTE